jgi:drug/metabolite transporter (DMT)-like permease
LKSTPPVRVITGIGLVLLGVSMLLLAPTVSGMPVGSRGGLAGGPTALLMAVFGAIFIAIGVYSVVRRNR